MASGGGSGSTTTTQTSTPWSGQQGYLGQVFSDAETLYNNPSDYPAYYPNSTVSPFNSMENNTINQAYLNGSAGGDTSLQGANSTLSSMLDPSYLGTQNPYQTQMNQNILASTVPSLEASFTQGNNMNNPAAAYAVSNGATNAIANSEYSQYQTDQTNQLKAALEAPGVDSQQLTDLNSANTAGQMVQQQSQSQLNNAINQYNYNQALPYNMLDQYANMISGNYGSTNNLTSPYYNNGTANTLSLLGSGASAASAGSSLYSALFGGSAAAGASAGGADALAEAAPLVLAA